MAQHSDDLLLGKQTPVVDHYSPDLLYPIARAMGRESLPLGAASVFLGADLWHAYEISWLDEKGKPEVRVGRFTVPADSPNMVESKSFKLYLNSLNNERFPTEGDVLATIQRDLDTATGASVGLELLPLDSPLLAGALPDGTCIDSLDIESCEASPDAGLLSVKDYDVEESLHSHLLRSLCPVTGQPDWASVWVYYRGRALDQSSLLRYIVSFRQHQDFHEQCVERMFTDIAAVTDARCLHVQAFYTRRGGMDINPFRSTDPTERPRPRMNRQ